MFSFDEKAVAEELAKKVAHFDMTTDDNGKNVLTINLYKTIPAETVLKIPVTPEKDMQIMLAYDCIPPKHQTDYNGYILNNVKNLEDFEKLFNHLKNLKFTILSGKKLCSEFKDLPKRVTTDLFTEKEAKKEIVTQDTDNPKWCYTGPKR